MYQSNFIDGGKQKNIDALLGHLSSSQKVRVFNPVNDALRTGMRARAAEFTAFEDTTIWVGTYNLNGQGPGSESLLPWLFPPSSCEFRVVCAAYLADEPGHSVGPELPRHLLPGDRAAHSSNDHGHRPGKEVRSPRIGRRLHAS